MIPEGHNIPRENGKNKNRGFAGENPKNSRISNTETEFTKPKDKAVRPILMEKEVQEFIDSIPAKNTRKGYIRALELFEQYTGKTVSETIKERREQFKSEDIAIKRNLERIVQRFYVYCLNDLKVASNSAYNYVTAIKSIMSFYDVNLKLKGISRAPTPLNDWIPNPDQLKAMHQVGDLKEKTLISLATNMPMRINDFNEILKSDILPLLDSTEFPVWFFKVTRKTKTPMPCFITEETMNLLRKYIKTLRDDNPFLFQGQGKKKLDEDSINRTLRNLVQKADIDTRGLHVRFHLFRKVFIGVARSMIGLSDDQIKMLTGKRVKGDMNPYYVSVELKPLFQKVSEKLKLTGAVNNNHEAIEKLQQALSMVESENSILKTRFENLHNQVDKLGAFLSMFMETTDMSDFVKEHYRRELGILGISDDIKKKFQKVDKLHYKGKTEESPAP